MNPERINIKDLTIEEPEKEVRTFDSERDITERDWEIVGGELKRLKNEKSWFDFSHQATAAKIIKPDIDIGVNAVVLTDLVKDLDSNKSNESWISAAALTANLKILNTGHLEFTNTDLSHWKSGMYDLKNQKDWTQLARLASSIKIINPHINLDINSRDWQEMKNHLETLEVEGDSFDLASYAMHMKIINPSENLDLSQSDWEKMRSRLEQYDQELPNRTFNFLKMAMAMKILAAEKVEIANDGMKITMPERKEPLESEASVLPEIRNF